MPVPSRRPVLALPVLAPVLLAPIALLAACGSKTSDQPAAAPTVYGNSAAEVSTDWTVENPTEPAVPVTLPTTRMAVPMGGSGLAPSRAPTR